MNRKIKNLEAIRNSYNPDVSYLTHFYLKKILSNFDIAHLQGFENILHFYEEDCRAELVEKLFIPAAIKSNEEEEDETRSHRYRRSSEFVTPDKKNYNLDDLSRDCQSYCDLDRDGIGRIQSILLEASEREIQNIDYEENSYLTKVNNTLQSLGLPEKSADLLLFLAILEQVEVLNDWLNGLSRQPVYVAIFQCISGYSRNEFMKINSENSHFVTFGILEPRHRHSLKDLELTNRFSEFVFNETEEKFGMNLIKLEEKIAQPISSFFLPEKDKNRIQSLLKSKDQVRILLYGIPGSGKTEFARSVVDSLQMTLRKVDMHNASDRGERRAALVVGETLSREPGNVLLFDEADDLLNEGGSQRFSFFKISENVPEKKIWMNDFLDSMQGKVIFITNETNSIHESVLRRFDYSLEFYPADQKQRTYYWNRILSLSEANPRLGEEQIAELAQVYPIGVGGISLGVASTEKICLESPNEVFIDVLRDVMTKHTHLVGAKVNKPISSKTPYDPAILHTDGDLLALERLVHDYKEKLETSEELNLGSLCLLFHGKPGTGKTEYARYLGQKLNIEIFQKRSSDLLDPYVGMTEKNIARAFKEAESSKAIFFLDEADSFFRSRELAKNSWEASHTNEFLTWMESFRGIFIASTNFIKDLDPASLRRFAWKGEFKPLRREDKIKILRSYFPNLISTLSYLDMENIKDLPGLTPGDFRAVWNRLRFTELDQITPQEIYSQLQAEIRLKSEQQGKVVGF